jgi:hypothetical protein
MDRIHAMLDGNRDDRIDIQISFDRLAPFRVADKVGFIRFEAMKREPIFVGKDRYRGQPKLGGGTQNADSDFASIGDEQFTHRNGWARK